VSKTETTEDLQTLVLAAIGTETTSITAMLKSVAQRFGAFGCGLWEIPKENSILIPSLKDGKQQLLTVAAWWEGDKLFALDAVPLEDSPTAKAAQTQQPIIIRDIQDKPQGVPSG
jgi:hypothetical protein